MPLRRDLDVCEMGECGGLRDAAVALRGVAVAEFPEGCTGEIGA